MTSTNAWVVLQATFADSTRYAPQEPLGPWDGFAGLLIIAMAYVLWRAARPKGR